MPKLNISYPATGLQKKFDIKDETNMRVFYDKRISQEVEGDSVGPEFKGYVFRISGGNDKQGFCMTQGVLRHDRTRILMNKGFQGYRQRRSGVRKRKSARGCIVDNQLSVLNLVIVKKGDNELPGVTDSAPPRRLGPKRASNIRKLFQLTKDDDVRQFVIRRTIEREGKKPYTKAPKIQRLVTPQLIQRKRAEKAFRASRSAKSKAEASDYAKLLAVRLQEAKTRKIERKRATSSRNSESRE